MSSMVVSVAEAEEFYPAFLENEESTVTELERVASCPECGDNLRILGEQGVQLLLMCNGCRSKFDAEKRRK